MMPPLRGLFCVAPSNRILLFYNFSFPVLNQHTGELSHYVNVLLNRYKSILKKTIQKKLLLPFVEITKSNKKA